MQKKMLWTMRIMQITSNLKNTTMNMIRVEMIRKMEARCINNNDSNLISWCIQGLQLNCQYHTHHTCKKLKCIRTVQNINSTCTNNTY